VAERIEGIVLQSREPQRLTVEKMEKAIRNLKAFRAAVGVEDSLIVEKRVMVAMDKRDPPKIAEFLLTALSSPSRADAIIGDLNERFADECEKLGRDRAVRLYCARTLRSLGPLLRRAIGKALKWGAVIAAFRRLF
jgi:hypothetical protein